MLLPKRIAPPKPPRTKSFLDSEMSPEHSMSPTPSVKSATLASPESSLADISSTLDASMSQNSPDISLVMRQNPILIKDKIYQVLVQTRDFIFFEINPENILRYLNRNGVINERTERELRQCSSRQSMCEMLLDIITSKGEEEFRIFCDALRLVEKQDYLADLLHVLDKLIETVTFNNYQNPLSRTDSLPSGANDNLGFIGSNLSMNANPGLNTSGSLSLCHCHNNNVSEENLNDCASFDIEIFYFNKESGEMKAICDVATIKKKGTRMHISKKDENFLTKMDRENAAKYIPVISLSLYNQCLIKSGIETLAKILEDHTCIRELSLAKNHIDAKAMKRLGESLQKNRGLVKLDIRLNTIDDYSAKYLSDGIRSNMSLRTINVTSTDLEGPTCNVLLEGMTKHVHLTDLNVGFNDIGNEGCKGVAKLLAANVSLKKLRMRDNGITSRGANVIFKALKKNSRLCYLDMSSNKIGGVDGMGTLAEVLVHNRTLKELNLEKCDISEAGCTALARALKTNTVMKILDLSMNPIKDDGVAALGEGLKYNQALDTLCLNMCGVGNAGFHRLLETLRFNSSMTTLKLCYNSIGVAAGDVSGVEGTGLDSASVGQPVPTGATASGDVPSLEELYDRLCKVLQFNKNLKVLLWGNKLDEPGTVSCYPEFSS